MIIETIARNPGFEQLLLQGMLLIKDTIKMAASNTDSTCKKHYTKQTTLINYISKRQIYSL